MGRWMAGVPSAVGVALLALQVGAGEPEVPGTGATPPWAKGVKPAPAQATATAIVARAEAAAVPKPVEPEVSTAAVSRAEAIAKTKAAVEAELEAHGGWEAWGKELAPYRDDIRGFVEDWKSYKWPWPAKGDHQFQGAVVSIHVRTTFDDLPEGYRPFDAILHLDRQLKALGIDLVVAIIPDKLSIYPDYLYAAVQGENRPVRAPEDRMTGLATRHLLYRLLTNDVEVVDLYKAYADYRRKNGDNHNLFLTHDAHYNNLGARVAAARIAERLMRYDFVRAGVANNPYTGVPGARTDGRKADANLLIIKDRQGNLYQDVADSPAFLIGDSHLGYNSQLGAFVSAQLAHYIGHPVSEVWQEGLCAEAPLRVAKDGFLKKRKVVILHYSERMLNPGNAPGKQWPIVNLPGAEAAAAK